MFGKYNGFVSKARVSACMYFLVLNILKPPSTTVADYLSHLQIKQKLFLLVLLNVLETVIVVVIDTEFSGTFYKYSI